MHSKNSYSQWPDEKGYFGKFGGRYVAETLMPLIMEVEKEYNNIRKDSSFKKEFEYYLEIYVGRPSPLFFAERMENIDKILLLNKNEFRSELREKIREELNSGLSNENLISEELTTLIFPLKSMS